MNRLDLIQRVRSLTRDLSNAIFREIDVVAYINEGIERFQQVIPEFKGLVPLESNTARPSLIPRHYRHLLAIYSASRCFAQDERHYQASNLMNEFETKLDALKTDIENGKVVIVDPATGEPIQGIYNEDYVVNNYYFKHNHGVDIDRGVKGVE